LSGTTDCQQQNGQNNGQGDGNCFH
jgi:hypothetical protein